VDKRSSGNSQEDLPFGNFAALRQSALFGLKCGDIAESLREWRNNGIATEPDDWTLLGQSSLRRNVRPAAEKD
jgi:hypothetical protein